jgi:osmotically-inducible protein OsmY
MARSRLAQVPRFANRSDEAEGGHAMFGKVCRASFAVLVLGLVAPACSDNRAPDPSDKVAAALKNANLKDVDVNYDKDERVVHLKGSVDNAGERNRAEQIAERAVGTSGKVLNEVTVKGVDDKTANDNDGKIKDRLKDMVDNDPVLKDRSVSFTVNNAAVEVSGTVASAAEKTKVTEMVRSVPEVRDVANGLEITPDKYKDSTPRKR